MYQVDIINSVTQKPKDVGWIRSSEPLGVHRLKNAII